MFVQNVILYLYYNLHVHVDGERVSVTELIVAEGLVEVRQANVRPSE